MLRPGEKVLMELRDDRAGRILRKIQCPCPLSALRGLVGSGRQGESVRRHERAGWRFFTVYTERRPESVREFAMMRRGRRWCAIDDEGVVVVKGEI